MRLGCVKYLNARPLIDGWSGDLTLDHPSVLCRSLANGDLDVALVSSFEYLRNPIYKIVDDVSIASAGPVYSVVVASQGELSDVREIILDPASETSVALLQYLLGRRGLSPRLEGGAPATPDSIGGLAGARPSSARLLIGDQAIRFRQSRPDYHFWDLGQEWQAQIDLPFVYALWLVRPETADAESIAGALRTLRDKNLSNIDQVIAGQTEFDPEFCRRYYREHLRFNFGQREKAGLRAFAGACAEHGLIAQGELNFVTV